MDFYLVLLCRRRNHPSNVLSSRQLRDLKPLNALSDDSNYDSTPVGVYARNAAFDPPTRTANTCRRQGNVDKAINTQAVIDADDDNEYEYVWDAAAGSAEVHCGGVDVVGRRKDHMTATFRRDVNPERAMIETVSKSGKQQLASGSSGRHHQCSCMTGGGPTTASTHLRTMPTAVRPNSHQTLVVKSNDTSGHRSGKQASTNAATLGRFCHLENRSASSSTRPVSNSKAAGLPTARTIDEPLSRGGMAAVPRVCPNCEHPLPVPSRHDGTNRPQTSATACSAGTPLTGCRRHRGDAAETLPHGQHQPMSVVSTHRFMWRHTLCRLTLAHQLHSSVT